MAETQSNEVDRNLALRQQLSAGFDLLRQDRVADATQLSDRLLASHPGHAEVLFLASETRLAAEDPESALAFISAALAAAPDQLALFVKKAENLIMLRRRTEARETAAAAIQLAGDDGHSLWEIGKIYSKCDEPTQARPIYAKARASIGNQPALLYDLAVAQFHSGDSAAAAATLETLLTLAPKVGHALYLRSTLGRQTEASNHVDDLRARLASGFPNATARAGCLYALAKELEDLGQADAAFSALTEGAVLKRQSFNYDVAAECAAIDAVRTTYSAAVMQTAAVGDDEAGAIFIVGMPRTGTTLVERMLSRHSEVKSAGELLDFGQALASAARKCQLAATEKSLVEASLDIDFAALGHDYLVGARQAAPPCRMFIDKMPINFIYCGLIKKALPKARILHLVRDPMDCAYAIYKTLFGQAYLYSYDLSELAAYYRSYHQLMQHWHAVMPGAILDVHYEDLVADTEVQARRILDWCGLDWQAAVLNPADNAAPSTTASAAQVREPIHTGSVHKWRQYAAGLAPLRARLVAAGILKAQAE